MEIAASAAKAASAEWSTMTVKRRAAVMFKFHQLVEKHVDELVELVVLENGKNRKEAEASAVRTVKATRCSC